MATYDDILRGASDDDEGPTPPESEGPRPIIGRRKRRADDDASGMIRRIAKEEGAPVDLVLAMAGQEGGRLSTRTSGAGAHGPLQVKRDTGLRFVTPDEFDTTEGQVRAGVRYVNFLGNKFGWDRPDLITAGYHAGEGAVVKAGYKVPHTYDKEAGIYTDQHVGLVMNNLKKIQGRDPSDDSTDQDQDRGYYQPAIPVDLSPPGAKKPAGKTYDEIIKGMPAPKKQAPAPTPTPTAPPLAETPTSPFEYTDPYKTPEKAAATIREQQAQPSPTPTPGQPQPQQPPARSWYDRLKSMVTPGQDPWDTSGPQSQPTPHNIPPAQAPTPQAQPTPPAGMPGSEYAGPPTTPGVRPTPSPTPRMPKPMPPMAQQPTPDTMGAAPPYQPPPQQPSLMGGIAQGVKGYLFPGAPPSQPPSQVPEPWDVTGRPQPVPQPTPAGTPPPVTAGPSWTQRMGSILGAVGATGTPAGTPPSPKAYTPQPVPGPSQPWEPGGPYGQSLKAFAEAEPSHMYRDKPGVASAPIRAMEGYPLAQSIVGNVGTGTAEGLVDLYKGAGYLGGKLPYVGPALQRQAAADVEDIEAWRREVAGAMPQTGWRSTVGQVVGAPFRWIPAITMGGWTGAGVQGFSSEADKGTFRGLVKGGEAALMAAFMGYYGEKLPSFMQSTEEVKAAYDGTVKMAGGWKPALATAIDEAKLQLLTRARAAGITGLTAAGVSAADQWINTKGEVSVRKMMDDGWSAALIMLVWPGLRTIFKAEPAGMAEPAPMAPYDEPMPNRQLGPADVPPNEPYSPIVNAPIRGFRRIKGLLPPAGGTAGPAEAPPLEPGPLQAGPAPRPRTEIGPGVYGTEGTPHGNVVRSPGTNDYFWYPPGSGQQHRIVGVDKDFVYTESPNGPRRYNKAYLEKDLGRDIQATEPGTVTPTKAAATPLVTTGGGGGGGGVAAPEGQGLQTIPRTGLTTKPVEAPSAYHPSAYDVPHPTGPYRTIAGGAGLTTIPVETGAPEHAERPLGPDVMLREDEKEKEGEEPEVGHGLTLPEGPEGGHMPAVGAGTAIPLPGVHLPPPGTEGPYEPVRPVSPVRPVEPIRPVSPYKPSVETPAQARARKIKEMAKSIDEGEGEGEGGEPPVVKEAETPEQARARKIKEASQKILEGEAPKVEEPIKTPDGYRVGQDNEGRPIVAVSRQRLQTIAESHSPDGLNFGVVSRPFTHDGNQYVATGSSHVNGERLIKAQELVPLQQWKDEGNPDPTPATKHDPATTGNDEDTGAPLEYHGRKVKLQGKDYVLKGPATVFRAYRPGEEESFQQAEPEPEAPEPPGQAPTQALKPRPTLPPGEKETLLEGSDSTPGQTHVETPTRTIGQNALWRLRNNYASKVAAESGDPSDAPKAAQEFDQASHGARTGDQAAAKRLDDLVDIARGHAHVPSTQPAEEPQARERFMRQGDSENPDNHVETPRRVIGPNAMRHLATAYASAKGHGNPNSPQGAHARQRFQAAAQGVRDGVPDMAEHLDNLIDDIPKEALHGPAPTVPETPQGGIPGVLPGGGHGPGPMGGGTARGPEGGEEPGGGTVLPGTPGAPGTTVTGAGTEPTPGVPGPPGPTGVSGGKPVPVGAGGGAGAVSGEPTPTGTGGVTQPVTQTGQGQAVGGAQAPGTTGATGAVPQKPGGVGVGPDTGGEPVETPAQARARKIKEMAAQILEDDDEPRNADEQNISRPRHPALNWWLAQPEPSMIPGVYESESSLPISTPPLSAKKRQALLAQTMDLINMYFEDGITDYDEIGQQVIEGFGEKVLHIAPFYNKAWDAVRDMHPDKEIEDPGDFDSLLIIAGLKEPSKQELQTPYISRSQMGKSMPVLMPANMAGSVQLALDHLERRRGQIDAFVAKEMGYTPEELEDRFLTHQIDAIGLMLDNFKKGSAFINGDATGMGKGRTVAAAIAWAVKQGIVPVFVTEKPGLYGDMIRDLTDIGAGHLKPFITNNSLRIPVNKAAYDWEKAKDLASEAGESAPPVPDDAIFLNTPDKKTHEAHMLEMMTAGALTHGSEKYDMIFTTYDQLNPTQDVRHRLVEQFTNQGLLLLDESHNAGGSGDQAPVPVNNREPRAQFIRRLADSRHSKAVLFSSATHAKRPEIMSLYARTDLSTALDQGASLIDILISGGVPLQQIATVMLAEAGQLIRREHDLSGIEYKTLTVEVNKKVADKGSDSMQGIQAFSHHVATVVIPRINAANAAAAQQAGEPRPPKLSANKFTSVMHNLVGQFLLALKLDKLADEVIASARKGEKPFVVLSNTMGAVLKEWADMKEAHPGDPMDVTFADVFERYLEKSRMVRVGTGQNAPVYRLTDDELRGPGQRYFARAMATIANSKFRMPASPIDYLHMRFKEAGLKSGEITGRTTALAYEPVSPKLEGTHNHGEGVNVAPGRKYRLQEENDKTREAYGPQEPWRRKALVREGSEARHETPKRIIHRHALWTLRDTLLEEEADAEAGAARALVAARKLVDDDPSSAHQALLVEAQKAWDEAVKNSNVRRDVIEAATEGARVDNPDGDQGAALDNLIDEIERAGIVPTLRRQHQTVKDKKLILNAYNSGDLDIILANRSAAAGLSAHASEHFSDQRKRRMFIGQAEPNIDQFMQLLGRINRIGQVTEPNANHNKDLKGIFGLPAYSQAAADIPLETRPSAVLEKKMASLNANTTGARSSAVSSKTAIDYINEYGDRVVAELLDADQTLNGRLGNPVRWDANKQRHIVLDAASKVTARFAFLNLEEQRALQDDIIDGYLDYVEREKKLGNNVLEASSLNLQAKTDAIAALHLGDPMNGSPFARAAYLERAEVNRLGRPPSSKDATKKMIEAAREALEEAGIDPATATLNDAINAQRDKFQQRMVPRLRQDVADYIDVLDKEYDEAQAAGNFGDAIRIDMERSRARANLGHMIQVMRDYHPGKQIEVTTSGGKLYGFVQNIRKKNTTSRNPAAPSTWIVDMLYADPMGHDNPAASKLLLGLQEHRGPRMGIIPAMYGFPKPRPTGGTEYIPMIQAFDVNRKTSRHRRYLATGNIIRAFARGAIGTICNFSDHTGAIRQGILLPPSFRPAKLVDEQPVFFTDAETFWRYLQAPRAAGENPAGKTADDMLELHYDRRVGEYQFDVTKFKRGAVYHESQRLLDIMRPYPLRPTDPQAAWDKTTSKAIFRTSDPIIARRIINAIYDDAISGEPMVFKVTEPSSERQYAREIAGVPPPDFSPVVPPEELPSREVMPGFKRFPEDGGIHVKYAPAAGRRIHGIIFGNERATLELHAIRMAIGGGTSYFSGINIRRSYAEMFVDKINDMLGGGTVEDEDIAGLTDLRDALRQALDVEPDEPTIGYVNADNSFSDEAVENTSMHEIGIHGWQENVGVQSARQQKVDPDDPKQLIDQKWLEAHPMYQAILAGVNQRGYPGTSRYVSVESLSHILSGEWRILGLNTFEEAAKWIHDILLHIAERHGLWAIDQLAYYHPSFQGVVKGVKDAFSEITTVTQQKPIAPSPPAPAAPPGAQGGPGPTGGGQAVPKLKEPGELSYAPPPTPVWPDELARQLTGAGGDQPTERYGPGSLLARSQKSPQGLAGLEAGLSQRGRRRGLPGNIAASQKPRAKPTGRGLILRPEPGAITKRWATPEFDWQDVAQAVMSDPTLSMDEKKVELQKQWVLAAANLQGEIHVVGEPVGNHKFKSGLPVPVFVGNGQAQFWLSSAVDAVSGGSGRPGGMQGFSADRRAVPLIMDWLTRMAQTYASMGERDAATGLMGFVVKLAALGSEKPDPGESDRMFYANTANNRSDQDVEQTLMHEIGVHGWQFALDPEHGHLALDYWIHARPEFAQLRHNLVDRLGYKEALIQLEAPAFILSDDWGELGYVGGAGLDQAADYITEYLMQAVKVIPEVAQTLDRLAQFVSPVFGKIIENVKTDVQKPGGTLGHVTAQNWPPLEYHGPVHPSKYNIGAPTSIVPQSRGDRDIRGPAPEGRSTTRPGEAGAYREGPAGGEAGLPERGQGGNAPGGQGAPLGGSEAEKDIRFGYAEGPEGFDARMKEDSKELRRENRRYMDARALIEKSDELIERFGNEASQTAIYLAGFHPGENPGPDLQRIARREGLKIATRWGPGSDVAERKSSLVHSTSASTLSAWLRALFPERMPDYADRARSREEASYPPEESRSIGFDLEGADTERVLVESEAYRRAHGYDQVAPGYDPMYRYDRDRDLQRLHEMRGGGMSGLTEREIEERLNEPITWDDRFVDEDKKAPPDTEISIAARVGTPKFKALITKYKEQADRQKYQILSSFAPETMGESGRSVALMMRDNLGQAAGKTDVANYLLGMEGVSDMMRLARKWGVATPGLNKIAAVLGQRDQLEPKVKEYLSRLPRQARYDFVDQIETGNIPSLPSPLKEYAELIRRLLDEARATIENLGVGKLKFYREHYYPRILIHPKNVGLRLKPGRRPITTRKTFLKARIPGIDTLKDALDAGYEPITDNPIDWLSSKLAEMYRYIAINNVLIEMRDRGYLHRVNASRATPKNYVDIDPSVGTIMTRNKKTGSITIWGRWIAPAPAANVINNWVSEGLERFALYRAARAESNLLNMLRLGVSGFHAGMTTLNAALQVGATAYQKLIYSAKDAPASAKGFQRDFGEQLGAMARMLYAATALPPAIEVGLLGRRAQKGWHDPSHVDPKHPEMQAVIKALQAGGMRAHTDRVYVNAMTRSLMGAIADLRKDKDFYSLCETVLKVPLALVEQTARPIMEYLVPYMKMGAAYQLMYQEMKRLGPKASTAEVRAVGKLVVDQIDNVFGQLVYDNLFWHKTVKDVAMLAVQSTAWKLGSLRLGLGSIKDAAKLLTNMGAHYLGGRGTGLVPPGGGGRIPPRKPPPKGKKGQPPAPPPPPRGERPGQPGEPLPWLGGDFEMTHKLAFTQYAAIIIGIWGAMLTIVIARRWPKGRDYYSPPDGTKDEYDRENRFQLPTYAKDYVRARNDPVKYMTSSAGPLLSSLIELMQNEDFYGNQIWTKDDTSQAIKDILWFSLEAHEPYSFKNYALAKERGASAGVQVLHALGVTPAPASEVQSDAERVGTRNIAEKGLGARPKQDQARYELKRRLIREMRMGGDISEKLSEAAEKGILSRKDVGLIERSGSGNRLQALFKMQTAEGAIKMWDAATPEERRELRPLLAAKIRGVAQGPGQRRDLLLPQIQKRLGQMPPPSP